MVSEPMLLRGWLSTRGVNYKMGGSCSVGIVSDPSCGWPVWCPFFVTFFGQAKKVREHVIPRDELLLNNDIGIAV